MNKMEKEQLWNNRLGLVESQIRSLMDTVGTLTMKTDPLYCNWSEKTSCHKDWAPPEDDEDFIWEYATSGLRLTLLYNYKSGDLVVKEYDYRRPLGTHRSRRIHIRKAQYMGFLGDLFMKLRIKS